MKRINEAGDFLSALANECNSTFFKEGYFKSNVLHQHSLFCMRVCVLWFTVTIVKSVRIIEQLIKSG